MKAIGKSGLASAAAAAVLVMGFTMTSPPARAQMAVIDVAAILQFLEQIAALQQQLSTMRNQRTTTKDQLSTSRDQLSSMSGGRGMDKLLGNEARNYLPANWQEMEQTLRKASTTFAALGQDVSAAEQANAILNDKTLAHYSPAERDIIVKERTRAASLQVMTRQALAATSARFASMSELVHAISTASDQKAILDLSARIGAEQGMLANEQTKLQTIQHMADADAAVRAQRVREASAQGVGNLRDLPPMGLKP